MSKKIIISLVTVILSISWLKAQEEDTTSFSIIEKKLKTGAIVQAVVKNGDTTYMYTLKPIAITEFVPFEDSEMDKLFKKYQKHVPIIYPFAKLAANKLELYNEELSNIKSKRRKKKLLRQKEKQLKEEFTDVIKKMSQTQGKILVKLIQRETGESTYDIIKENRGGFNAFIWQGVARLWGNNLKYSYEPDSDVEDAMIERIVLKIEEGQK